MNDTHLHNSAVRLEHDSLGTVAVPAAAYHGAQTQRAIENFPITGVGIGHFHELIRALGLVKKAAAHANVGLGILDPTIGEAISRACDELIEGRHHDQFPVDVFQGGAGTSTNMNANEAVANLALEFLGREMGACALMLGEDIRRIEEVRPLVAEMNLGATAVGTGIHPPDGHTDRVREC